MKTSKILLISAAIAATLPSLYAHVNNTQPVITTADMARSDAQPDNLFVSYTVDRSAWHLSTNTEVVLQPVLHFAGDSIELTPVIFAGRTAYMADKRNHSVPAGSLLVRAKGDAWEHIETIPYDERMGETTISFRTITRGCRCKEEGTASLPYSYTADLNPKFNLIVPERDLLALERPVEKVVKTRSLSRSAHVNYPVNRTELLPDFRSNPIELAAILATIDSVRSDADLTVDHVSIHGYASPEGSYELNARLAAGRTESLRNWVDARYGFGSKLSTASTAEDWEGLRKWVELSALANRDGILRIIDSSMVPDEKDAMMRSSYPADYALMLDQVYPSLRRADYRIDYTVKNYTDTRVIGRELQSHPDRLSYEEMMMLARTYDEGSDRRYELLLEAAELLPGDERAQLNAAFAALGRGQLDIAKSLLDRSGQSPLATYARGVYYLYKGEKNVARGLLERAAAAGVDGAAAALKLVRN